MCGVYHRPTSAGDHPDVGTVTNLILRHSILGLFAHSEDQSQTGHTIQPLLTSDRGWVIFKHRCTLFKVRLLNQYGIWSSHFITCLYISCICSNQSRESDLSDSRDTTLCFSTLPAVKETSRICLFADHDKFKIIASNRKSEVTDTICHIQCITSYDI